MLRKKLKLSEKDTGSENLPKESEGSENQLEISEEKVVIKFEKLFYEKIFDLEKKLSSELLKIDYSKDKNITCIYNPIDYASELHIDFMRKYLKRAPKILYLGMNPGLLGMVQTSVPFGSIPAMKNFLKIEGNVRKPEKEISSKPIEGLDCSREEMSGKRLWGLIEELCEGNPENFFRHSFIYNICPLAFLNSSRNITPVEIKGDAKKQLNEICLNYLAEALNIFKPITIVSIGTYANDCIKNLKKRNLLSDSIECKLLPHPSPRALNNQNWVEKARQWMIDNDMLKYFKNE